MNSHNMLLDIQNLNVKFRTDDGVVKAVNDMGLQIGRGKTLGLVGETGAEKTTTAFFILRLIPDPPGIITGGSIALDGENILVASKRRLEKTRGSLISMISQDPMTSLNPILPVDEQIAEVYILHERIDKQETAKKADEMLELVGIPASRGYDYPHQFSGGARQRVITAMALVCNSKLLTADEPTTTLDIIIQTQVLRLMKELKSKYDMSMLMITHDPGTVAEVCDEIFVIYAGRTVEHGMLEGIYGHTAHSCTERLSHSIPNIDTPVHRLTPIPGLMPGLIDLPPGCLFVLRCSYTVEERSKVLPTTIQLDDTHSISCILR